MLLSRVNRKTSQGVRVQNRGQLGPWLMIPATRGSNSWHRRQLQTNKEALNLVVSNCYHNNLLPSYYHFSVITLNLLLAIPYGLYNDFCHLFRCSQTLIFLAFPKQIIISCSTAPENAPHPPNSIIAIKVGKRDPPVLDIVETSIQ